MGLYSLSFTQGVYENGTFVSLPAGKHVNHSYYGTWNAYFAVEDGVLVYNHHEEHWLDPITSSNGLSQYPALLVWQDPGTQEVWIVTPDFVFIYDPLTQWMEHQPLPKDSKFSGKYELGVSLNRVVITSRNIETGESYSALFIKSSGNFDSWGQDSTLDVEWDAIERFQAIDPTLTDLYGSLAVQTISNGNFDSDGLVHLDGYPNQSSSSVSALSGLSGSGDVFLSTYGMGVFHQKISGGEFIQLPFGLLSPDVMSLKIIGDQLLVGGRAGLTLMKAYDVEYDEAIRDTYFDYSFISAIDSTNSDLWVAGRGGVFKKSRKSGEWQRIVSKQDLTSTRIYSIAAGIDGNLMIATERNAFLYHESGLVLQILFPEGLDWPVFDITYLDGKFYISTLMGLFIYDEFNQNFSARVDGYGEMHPPQSEPAIDPIYKCLIIDEILWATTSRGLMTFNLVEANGNSFLAPHAPFKPRGLTFVGGRAWIGTDIGMYTYDSKSSTWRHYTTNDGIISNFVTDLAADSDYIWVGTNLGLTRVKWQNLY